MVLFYFSHYNNPHKHFFIKSNTRTEAQKILKTKHFFTYRNYLMMCSIEDTRENRKKYVSDCYIINEKI